MGICGGHSDEWWFAWLKEAEELWMWHALLAEEINAEILSLPGPCFHAFFLSPVTFSSTEVSDDFNTAISALIGKVREVYGGKVTINGDVIGFDFPSLADYVTAGAHMGIPDLATSASVVEWKNAWDSYLASIYDPLFDRWEKPLFFTGLSLPPAADEPDPANELRDARFIEGFFQAIADRPWIMGTMSWGYLMVDQPLVNGQGVRARAAEAVLAKYYGIFAPPIVPNVFSDDFESGDMLAWSLTVGGG